MPHRSFRVTLVGFSLAAFACGGAASYSGSTGPRVSEPIRIGAGDRAPDGFEQLGSVSADCCRVDARGGLDGARLSDVGCSSALLRAALRERAASAGGAFLVGERCDADDPSRADGSLECEAEVWGPASGTAAAPLEPLAPNVDPWGPAAPLGVAYGAVDDAWHVLVDYWPEAGAPARAPVNVESVGESDFPRVGHVNLGNVRARADVGRRVESVRGALRAAAARAGASSLVGVRCISTDDEQICVAGVAAPEVVEQLGSRGALAPAVADMREPEAR